MTRLGARMMTNLDRLIAEFCPDGVEYKNFGKLAKILRGGSPRPISQFITDSPDGVNWIKIGDVAPGGKYITSTKEKIIRAGMSKSRFVKPGDFVLSNSMSFGRPYIMRTTGCIHDGWLVLKQDGQKVFDTEFLYYLLSSPYVSNQFDNLAAGSTVRNLNIALVSSVQVPIPPLPEQKRIVAILDEYFTAIDKVKANAEKNLKNAKELFDSVLNEQLTINSEQWEEKKLKDLTTILGDGLHGTPKYTVNGEYYFINGNNLNDGKIEIKENTKRVNAGEFVKHKKILNDRTVLVSINGTLGNIAFYNGEKIILGKSACYFNLKESVDKNFVKYVLSSSYFLRYAHREATGATIKNVSLKSMREFRIPFPSLKEQKAIVLRLDALRAETQKLEMVYNKKIADLEELKKSILQRSFAGELTGIGATM